MSRALALNCSLVAVLYTHTGAYQYNYMPASNAMMGGYYGATGYGECELN